jgi:hypothetical protein
LRPIIRLQGVVASAIVLDVWIKIAPHRAIRP